jgi:cyclophilin family peptidyl-prolyl cis-trans isomerase
MNLAFAVLLSLASAEGSKLTIESPEKVFRPGRKMMLRFTIENDTEGEAKLEEPESYLEGLEIRDPEDHVVKPTGKTKGIARRAATVDARGFIGRTADISSVLAVPEDKEGFYKIRWSFGDSTSNEIRILIIRDWLAEIDTNYGKITIEFRPDVAPNHVLNFLRLARTGFYEPSKFHRIIAGFMMQGGAPLGGKSEVKPLKAEFSSVKHVFGTVSAARTDAPDSATSEFFICFAPVPQLDGKYTVFGQVVAGDDVVKDVESVKTDHVFPCKVCGMRSAQPGSRCCGGHHLDKPESDVVIKKVTLIERKK